MGTETGIFWKYNRQWTQQVKFRLKIRPGFDALLDMGITIDNSHKNSLTMLVQNQMLVGIDHRRNHQIDHQPI
jgi:hypothetical protein